jgi:hypothetical protein
MKLVWGVAMVLGLTVQAGCLSTISAQNPTFDWAFNVEDQNAPSGYVTNGHDLASFGEFVYVAGTFAGTADFDPGPGTAELTSFGGFDIFIQKLDTNGNFIWVKQFGGPSDDGMVTPDFPFNGFPDPLGLTINVTDVGDLVMSATFTDSIDANPDENNELWFRSEVEGLTACLAAKITSNGEMEWARRTSSANSNVYSSDVNTQGEIYLAGNFSFWTPVDFDPSPLQEYFLESDAYDIFIQKLTSSGDLDWVIQFPNASNGDHVFIELDNNGDIVFSGTFHDTVDFDPGLSEFILIEQNATGEATFVCKLSDNAEFIWSGAIQNQGGGGYDRLVVDDLNNIYFSQVITQQTDVDLTTDTLYIEGDVQFPVSFVVKYSLTGDLIWAQGVPSTWPQTLAIGEQLWIAGRNSDQADFNPGPAVEPGTAMDDAYVLSLDSSGQFRWVHGFSTSSLVEVRSLERVGSSIFGTGFSSDGIADCSPEAPDVALGEDMFVFKWNDAFLVGNSDMQSADYSGVLVYPNPSAGTFYVEFENPTRFESRIYSNLGQLCYSQTHEPAMRVPLQLGTTPGVYQVVLIFSNKTETFKVVKQ